MYLRIALFSILALTALLAPLPVFLFGACIYIFFWSGHELLAVGIVIDSVYGTTSTSFLYTLSLGTILIIFSFLRPYLSWYTTQL
jgi:hypothetical protein